jgi:hypothetical protein
MVTTNNDFGSGTLRSAILAANASSGDTIEFTGAVRGFMVLQSALPPLTKSMTIAGPGASALAITGGQTNQCFTIIGGTVAISGLTIENCAGSLGGGIENVGGNLTLSNVTLQGNTAATGGGIFSAATLTMTNVNLTGNSAESQGGALFNTGSATLTFVTLSGNSATLGGALFNASVLKLINVTFSVNSAVSGGALFNASTTIGNVVTFSGNKSSADGGAANNAQGTLGLVDTSFIGNTAGTLGGGLHNVIGGTAVLLEGTMWGNSASGAGGAIESDANTVITDCTLANNSAPMGGDVFSTVSALVQSSILAHGSEGGNCAHSGAGLITSNGYNLSDDGTCGFVGVGDLNNTNPLLSPAGAQNSLNGSITVALLPNSPAVDRIPSGSCSFIFDQRGVPRPQGSGCDIGAYELAEFSGFTAHLGLNTGFVGRFNLTANVTLGSSSDNYNPASDVFTLQVGPYLAALPAGAFHSTGSNTWAFAGVVSGAPLSVTIEALGKGRYEVTAQASPVNLFGVTSPTTVSLTLGYTSGTIRTSFNPAI